MRPVIATLLVLAWAVPASAADPPAGVIRVTATYPGADARTVDETVLAPLFAQINGVEGLTRIESEARNDGTGTITVYFEPKTDLNLAHMLVQIRASLALPVLPAPCRQLGMAVRKLPTGPAAYWFALTSSDDKHDAAFLGAYATVRLKDELARIPGVADVRVAGTGEFGVQVRLKPHKLLSYKLTTGDVVDALRRQNAGVAAGASRGPALQFTASGRLRGEEQFADVILKTSPHGEVLRVRDVARVDSGPAMGGFARVNGKPAALIAVAAWPGRVTEDKNYKFEAADDMPPGMGLDSVADRAADRLLEVEVRLPDSASQERTEKVVGRATELIRRLPGKPGTVALAEGHAANAATILIKLPAKAGPTATDVERVLAVIPEAAIRVGGVPPGGEAFPVRLALTDPGDRGEEQLRDVADRVLERLKKDAGVRSAALLPGPPVSQFVINVDRDKCATRGLELSDVFTTLQAAGGGVHATDFTRFGRTCPVTVQNDLQFSRKIEDLKQLIVRSSAGEMIPLETVVTARKALVPPTVVRVNGSRAVVITADPPAGKTPAEAAARCVKLAQEDLPWGYYVKDLTGPSR